MIPVRMLALSVGLLVAAAAMVASPAVAAPAASASSAQLVVKLRPGVAPEAVLGGHGLTMRTSLMPSRGLYSADLARAPKPKDLKHTLDETIHDLKHDDRVVFAELYEPDRLEDGSRFHAWPTGAWSPAGTDPAVWTGQRGLAYLGLAQAHRVASGTGITVAILDTGIDPDHPSLAGHLTAGGYDYIDDDSDPRDVGNGTDDDGDGRADEAYGHGTHAAGLVALLAPGSDVRSYRVLDADGVGDPWVVAEAINDAVAGGADVINMSFGVSGKLESKVLRKALKNALKNDVVIVAAAGNIGSDEAFSPAGEKDVVGVGATSIANDALADFSNFGKWTLIAAPGVDIVSTVPGGGYGQWSGTSMSTAIVSGEVALLRGFDPESDRKKIIEALAHHSIKLRGANKAESRLLDLLRALDQD